MPSSRLVFEKAVKTIHTRYLAGIESYWHTCKRPRNGQVTTKMKQFSI